MNDSDQLFSEFPDVSAEQWQQKIVDDLKGKPFEDLIWHTREGFDVKPFYTNEDLEKIKNLPHDKKNAAWEIRQDFVVRNVADANASALEALQSGMESVGFDVSGIEISKEALLKLSEGINQRETPIHLIGFQLKSWDEFVSWLQMTPNTKGSLYIDNTSIDKLKKISKLTQSFPDFHFITIRNTDKHETITERITALSGEGKEIILAASELGLPLSNILSTMRFEVSLTTDYFMEIAGLRALRQLWSEEIKKYADEETPVFIHAANALPEIAANEAHLNILAASTTSMSAIIGGCNSLSLKPSPIKGKSASFSERIFRNIQLLLKHESYFNKVNDPAKGSYCLETLTAELVQAVKRNFNLTSQIS